MPKLIRIKSNEDEVLVAVRLPNDHLEAAGAVSEKVVETAEKSLDSVFRVARVMAESFGDVIDGQKLTKGAEIEFGLDLSGKGNVYVVEAGANASIKVKFSY